MYTFEYLKKNEAFLFISLSKIENPLKWIPKSGIKEKEFHISRKIRDKYKFKDSLFHMSGNMIFPDFVSVKLFTELINKKRNIEKFPDQLIKAGQINAMGMIDEILHYVIELYREEKEPEIMKKALNWLYKKLGVEIVDNTLLVFAEKFPPLSVYKGKYSAEEYINKDSKGVPNKQILLEEMIMLWISNVNPAFKPFNEFYDNALLKKQAAFNPIIQQLNIFFDSQPFFGPDNENLISMLRSPAIFVPNSLSGQLIYMKKKWGFIISKYLSRILSGLDLIKEEEKRGFHGPGKTSVYNFTDYQGMNQKEGFSPDRDWMPNLVLIAKNIYVWMDQLSIKYNKSISRLDQIPEDELQILSNQGFTGLWLIGIWERSPASKKIKQMCGNPEAMASAYSIHNYNIASDLGGDEALYNLKERLQHYGIRLACDMVPNHMGIDSTWVAEHPDWFLSLDKKPFESYSFNGPDLSSDNRIEIFLEDHYYNKSDASVVFKRRDKKNGETRYIYHGNDGTSMPWNDTAQLNYLNPEVRETVIQQIISVARKFPIIRFDAAMTLTKKHYQRLWFPEPGSGGDIPTRSEKGMTKKEFDKKMHGEFWREVVDRIAKDVPDTLLLAEAFWLMETYFVRNLGMHRVYNSAFMNFLKNEDNDKFRTSIKNVLKFNPEILKRFVNFMNNPDEETAIAQFGKNDKYFGICTLLVTLPGLPMFGHGQIEGFEEKYGMEYMRAYMDENPDKELIQRHEREIFPLIKKRHLFSEVSNFLFYDFYTSTGTLNENVIAFSNRFHDEKSIVIFHNKFASTSGWIKNSISNINLGQGLGLHTNKEYFVIFRDHITNMEYIRNCKELLETGLYIELNAFKFQVFLDFYEIKDSDNRIYSKLDSMLKGKGVSNISETLRKNFLNPLIEPFKDLVNIDIYHILDMDLKDSKHKNNKKILNLIEKKCNILTKIVSDLLKEKRKPDKIVYLYKKKLNNFLYFQDLDDKLENKISIQSMNLIEQMISHINSNKLNIFILFSWIFVNCLKTDISENSIYQNIELIEYWSIDEYISEIFLQLGAYKEDSIKYIKLIKVLTRYQQSWAKALDENKDLNKLIDVFFKDNDVKELIGVNQHQNTLWFNKESFEEILNWIFLILLLDYPIYKYPHSKNTNKMLCKYSKIFKNIQISAQKSGFKFNKFIEIVKKNLLVE